MQLVNCSRKVIWDSKEGDKQRSGIPLPPKGIGRCFAVCRPHHIYLEDHHNYYHFSKQSQRLGEQLDPTRGSGKSKKFLRIGVRSHPTNFWIALFNIFLYNYYYKMTSKRTFIDL